MTGKDILNEEFERSGMRGYRSEQVDLFLKTVSIYVDEINSKNEDLSYKLKILADKIEEYKKDEGSIRDALLGAQKLASSVLEEANLKAENITRESRSTAEELLAQAKGKIELLTKDSLQKANIEITAAKRECEREQRRLDSMKQEVSVFRSSILKQYKTHLDLLSNLPSVDPMQQKPEPEQHASANIGVVEEKQEVSNVGLSSDVISSIFDSAPEIKTQASRTKFTNPISYTKVVEEVKPDVKDIQQETDNTILEQHNPIPKPETIKTDIIATEEEIKQEIRLQTKEFNSSARKPSITATDMNDRGSVAPAIPFNPPKKSSMAGKFGELDFGKNKE